MLILYTDATFFAVICVLWLHDETGEAVHCLAVLQSIILLISDPFGHHSDDVRLLILLEELLLNVLGLRGKEFDG
jgi:hypothetical protein